MATTLDPDTGLHYKHVFWDYTQSKRLHVVHETGLHYKNVLLDYLFMFLMSNVIHVIHWTILYAIHWTTLNDKITQRTQKSLYSGEYEIHWLSNGCHSENVCHQSMNHSNAFHSVRKWNHWNVSRPILVCCDNSSIRLDRCSWPSFARQHSIKSVSELRGPEMICLTGLLEQILYKIVCLNKFLFSLSERRIRCNGNSRLCP